MVGKWCKNGLAQPIPFLEALIIILEREFVSEHIGGEDDNFLLRPADHYVQSILVKEKDVERFEV